MSTGDGRLLRVLASQERGERGAGNNHERTNATDCVGCGVYQIERNKALQRAYRRAEAATPRENAPKVGAIRNLGLLDREEDTRSVLGGSSK